MGELIRLPGAVIEGEGPTPSKEIIAYLELALERAKSGQLQAFGFVGVNSEDLTTSDAFYVADPDCRNSLMAAASYLWHEIVTDCRAAATETETEAGGDS